MENLAASILPPAIRKAASSDAGPVGLAEITATFEVIAAFMGEHCS